MIKKLNNKQLILILLALVVGYGITAYVRNKKGENTFHTNIIPKIDSNKLTTFYIYPKIKTVKPIKFELKGKNCWMVSQDGVTSRAEARSQQYVIKLIEGITPDRLATNDPAQWKDFDVTDSAGTRIVLLNNADTLIDLLVGKFSYNTQLRKAMSCVRIHGQNEVYSVDGFLTMNVANDFVSWRDRHLVTGDAQTWMKLTYTGDNGFTVTHDLEKGWLVDDQKPDSLVTAQLLQKLSMQNYGSFVDNFDTNKMQATYTLKVEGTNIPTFILKAYPSADTASQYVITSSLNPGAYMNGKNQNMFRTIFMGRDAFFQHPEAPKAVTTKGKNKK